MFTNDALNTNSDIIIIHNNDPNTHIHKHKTTSQNVYNPHALKDKSMALQR